MSMVCPRESSVRAGSGAARCARTLSVVTAFVAAAGFLGGCEDQRELVALLPDMTLDPSAGTTLVFDEVVLTRTEVDPREVRIGNVGTGVLEIRNVRFEGPGAGEYRTTVVPGRIEPGSKASLFVRFEPTAPGPPDAELVFESNDREQPEVRYPLAGSAREPCAIRAGPEHQTFLLGEVRQVRVDNVSSADCEITLLQLDRRLFDIVGGPQPPFVIAAGQAIELEVQHTRFSTSPIPPIRELFVYELEGSATSVTLEGEPPLFGCLSIFPGSLTFPATPRGGSVDLPVTVSNGCTEEAAVTSAVISDGTFRFEVLDDGRFPAVVPPLGSIEVRVRYHAGLPDGDRGRLVVNTNDGNNPRLEVTLFGIASLPNIEVFPPAIDFGDVVFQNPSGPQNQSECASREEVVQVYSTGDAPLNVSRLEVESDGDPVFEVAGVEVAGQPLADLTPPIVVPPTEEMRIALRFSPTRRDPAAHAARLVLGHNGPGDDRSVALGGRSVDAGVVEDTFTQLEGPKVDILWVIDASCSMFDEQARLIGNLSQFVGFADSVRADYQMGVTTTDGRSSFAGQLERCFPHPTVISSTYPAREEAFRCTFDVGTNGGAIEEGLGAAKRALERAVDPTLDPATNPNAGLLRDDAKLAVVVMSDEEDQSLLADPVLRDFFFSVKGAHRPDRVAVHAIAGPVAEACDSGIQGAQPGFRYFWMAEQTNGQFFNICETDWQPVLQGLGLDVFTPLDEWDLTQIANPATLVVTVDGMAVPVDPSNGYTYNPAGNSVRFHGTAIPGPGAEVLVNYSGLCRP